MTNFSSEILMLVDKRLLSSENQKKCDETLEKLIKSIKNSKENKRLVEEFLDAKHAGTFSKYGYCHGPKHSVGSHTPKGIKPSPGEYSLAVIDATANESHGYYVGSQLTGRQGREQPQNKSSGSRGRFAAKQRLQPVHNLSVL